MPTDPTIRITGMGWRTPLGNDFDGVFDSLLVGQTGFRDVPSDCRLRNTLAAPVPEYADMPPSPRLRALATDAIRAALEDACREPTDPSVRLVMGTSLGDWLEDEGSRSSLFGWTRDVASDLGFKREPVAVSTACSSATDSIMLGAWLIRSGAADCCVCGGADVLTISKRLAHSALGTMSPTLLRAFDARHDGTLLGEGAAFLVLEKGEPVGRNYGFLRGVGSANDAAGMTAADTTGGAARMAIERSLRDAGIGVADVGVINAHGSGTPMNDETEGNAFRQLFSSYIINVEGSGPVVFGTKGNFGHSLGATGAIESIALLLAMERGKIPPVVGLEQPDPEFPLALARGRAADLDARFGINVTLGFGGYDTSLVFEGVRA